MKRVEPPKLAEKLLGQLCKEELLEEILGDLQQYYNELEIEQQWKKNLYYWFHALNFLRPFALRKSKQESLNHYTMFRHNILISYRSFKRYKTSFFINLAGLSTGLTCALLIYLWVHDELQVDTFHENDAQLYLLLENKQQANSIETITYTSGLMAQSLAEERTEVAHAVTVREDEESATLTFKDNSLRASGVYVDRDFFHVFTFPLIYGEKSTVLADKNAIIISESLAIGLFGSVDKALDQTIEFQKDEQFLITGIFEDVPENSTLKFDYLLSFEKYLDDNEWALRWGNEPADVYVVLKPDTDVNQFNESIADYVKIKSNNGITDRVPFLVPFSKNYLFGKYENGKQIGGRIQYVRLFSIIAVFILVIASINFMNLSTARASRRLKEIGVKKVVGASRKALIFQHFSDSMLIVFLSMVLALLLVILILPHFNEITGKHLNLILDQSLTSMILGITIMVGLLAGSYPAIYLSQFRPITILKGRFSTSTGVLWTRKGLVVFQFALSTILIVAVLVVYKQMEFLQTKNLGFSRDNMIYFDREGALMEEEHLETYLSELRNIKGVSEVSGIGHDLTGNNWGTYGHQWEGKDPEDNTRFEVMPVYYDMMEILGMELKEGRMFSRDFKDEGSKIIFNEVAIEHMGLKDPIGKTFTFWGVEKEIVGVVKNIHFESLHKNVRPQCFRFMPNRINKFMVKSEVGMEQDVIAGLYEFNKKFNPGFALNYKFLDKEYEAQYKAEQRVSTLSKYFAGIAILISCLGLFGLAAFTAERRIKEIGVRKVLGASVFGIIQLLTSDFTKMVLAAILIALPLSYFIANWWLEGFAYRINLEWWFFVGAGTIALLIAWITVGFQTVKAANINPVECLKDE